MESRTRHLSPHLRHQRVLRQRQPQTTTPRTQTKTLTIRIRKMDSELPKQPRSRDLHRRHKRINETSRKRNPTRVASLSYPGRLLHNGATRDLHNPHTS